MPSPDLGPGCTPCFGLQALFYSDDYIDQMDAKAICAGCDLQARCLETALVRNEAFGIFGGLDAKERQRFRRLNGSTRVRRVELAEEYRTKPPAKRTQQRSGAGRFSAAS